MLASQPFYRLNLHHLRQNWNFNRWFVILGSKVFFGRPAFTQLWSRAHRPNESEMSSRFYLPLRGKTSPEGSNPDLIVVAEHGRFGNNVRQIAYALAVARKLGVREVVAKSLPLTPIGSWEVEEGLYLTHDPLLRPRIVTKPKVILGGDFFVVRRLPVSVDEFDYSPIGRALARATGLEPEVPLEEETLVIHVRSGDAFSSHPHGALGQPPLSFYQMALAELSPNHVVLVFEDEANPVIGSLREFLLEKKISFTEQCSDLRSDFRTILAAKNLVLAQGTLGQAMVLLSRNLEKLITFGSAFSPQFPKSSAPQMIAVEDVKGDYKDQVMRGNWENSLEQRNLMMTYPSEFLAVQAAP